MARNHERARRASQWLRAPPVLRRNRFHLPVRERSRRKPFSHSASALIRMRSSGAVQHQRMRIVTGRAEHLPVERAEPQLRAGRDRLGEGEALAGLAGSAKRQAGFVPIAHRVGFGCGNRGTARPCRLQQRVAAAVIRMQMRVDDQIERSRAERLPHERDGLRRVRRVAGIDQSGALCRRSAAHCSTIASRVRRPGSMPVALIMVRLCPGLCSRSHSPMLRVSASRGSSTCRSTWCRRADSPRFLRDASDRRSDSASSTRRARAT